MTSGGANPMEVASDETLLRSRRLVSWRRDGKNNFYYVDSAFLSGLLEEFFTATGNGQRQIQLDGMAVSIKSR